MLEQIKKMVADNLGVEESKITENASFKDDLGADSLDLFELTMALEDEYGIEIPSEDLEKIVDDILHGRTEDQGLFIKGFYPNGRTKYYAIDLAE